MAHRILGLDLGTSSVKAVLLETTIRGFTLVDVAETPLPAPAEGLESLRDRQLSGARDLLAGRGWTFETAVAALPGVAAPSHFVTLPFSDTRRIEQTVLYEVEAAIPFSLEEVCWDWLALDQQPGRSDLLVGVVRKDELAALLAGLAPAGVDPAVVVPGAPALAALWASGAVADPVAPPEAELAVDLGFERTHACVVSEGRCLFARTFAGGSSSLARALARDLGVGEAEAATVLATGRLEPGGGFEPRLGPSLRRALAPLVRELRATQRAADARPSRRPVRQIRLAGGAAAVPGLGEALAGDLGIPVLPLSLQGSLATRLGAEEAERFALPLSLALRGWLGARFQRLNLRRGEFASTRSFQDTKDKLTRFAVYAGLVLLLALVSSGVKVVALSQQEKLLDQSLCDVTQKVVGKCFDDFTVAESVLRGRGTVGASVPRVSATGVLAELAARTPAVPLKFDRIEITRDKLHLQGTTGAAENVDRIVSSLRASRCFADARSGGARRRGAEAKFEFTVDSSVTCEGAPAPGEKG